MLQVTKTHLRFMGVVLNYETPFNTLPRTSPADTQGEAEADEEEERKKESPQLQSTAGVSPLSPISEKRWLTLGNRVTQLRARIREKLRSSDSSRSGMDFEDDASSFSWSARRGDPEARALMKAPLLQETEMTEFSWKQEEEQKSGGKEDLQEDTGGYRSPEFVMRSEAQPQGQEWKSIDEGLSHGASAPPPPAPPPPPVPPSPSPDSDFAFTFPDHDSELPTPSPDQESTAAAEEADSLSPSELPSVEVSPPSSQQASSHDLRSTEFDFLTSMSPPTVPVQGEMSEDDGLDLLLQPTESVPGMAQSTAQPAVDGGSEAQDDPSEVSDFDFLVLDTSAPKNAPQEQQTVEQQILPTAGEGEGGEEEMKASDRMSERSPPSSSSPSKDTVFQDRELERAREELNAIDEEKPEDFLDISIPLASIRRILPRTHLLAQVRFLSSSASFITCLEVLIDVLLMSSFPFRSPFFFFFFFFCTDCVGSLPVLRE